MHVALVLIQALCESLSINIAVDASPVVGLGLGWWGSLGWGWSLGGASAEETGDTGAEDVADCGADGDTGGGGSHLG